MPRAARARPGNEGGFASAGGIRAAHAHAAAEVAAISQEAGQQRVVLAAKDFNVGFGAGVGPGDYVGETVIVDVAGRHEDTAGEGGGIGEEAGQLRAILAAENLDVRPRARAGPGDD